MIEKQKQKIRRKMLFLSLVLGVFVLSFASPLFKSYGTASTVNLLIPLYEPVNADWTTVQGLLTTYPTLNLTIIANPASGPGSSANATLATGISNFQTAGGKVFGYVSTAWGAVLSTTVQGEIANWSSWYSVDGIFLDEMNPYTSGAAYYSDLTTYAHGLGLKTVCNPGVSVSVTSILACDAVIIYENAALPTVAYLSTFSAYDRTRIGFLAYNVATVPNQTYISQAGAYAGLMYVTSDNLPNPWDSIPAYLSTLASRIVYTNGEITTTILTTMTTTLATSALTITSYQSANPVSLNFWFFPALLIGSFAGIFFFVAIWFQGDNDDSLHMGLLGAITGTFIAFSAQIIMLGFLAVELVLYFIYAWKGKQ